MSRKAKISFNEAVKHFTFEQFYEICKIFGINVLDKEEFKRVVNEAKEKKEQINVSDIHFRRDFDVMTEELIEKYNAMSRKNRRQIDPIVAKIVWANKQAQYLTEQKIKEEYDAGIEVLDKVQEIDKNTHNAAEATGDDN